VWVNVFANRNRLEGRVGAQSGLWARGRRVLKAEVNAAVYVSL